MSYLLDTHTLLWQRLQPAKLTNTHKEIIVNGTQEKFISTITVWEISLKFALGKLDLGGHSPEEFLDSALDLGFQIISPAPEQLASYHNLPLVTGHRDPFDRMLVWQAIQSDMTLLTQDKGLVQYEKHGLQLVN